MLEQNTNKAKSIQDNSQGADTPLELGLRVLARIIARDLILRNRTVPDSSMANIRQVTLPGDDEGIP
jgi:hypothetical protein